LYISVTLSCIYIELLSSVFVILVGEKGSLTFKKYPSPDVCGT